MPWLNYRVQREHLFMKLLWATAQLLVSWVNPIYLVDEFISLLQRLPKGMRMLGESKILTGFFFFFFFFFWCWLRNDLVGLGWRFSCVNLGIKSFSDLPETGWYNLVHVECLYMINPMVVGFCSIGSWCYSK